MNSCTVRSLVVAAFLFCLLQISGVSAQPAASEAGNPIASSVHFANGHNAPGIPMEVMGDAMFVIATINDSVNVTLHLDTGFGGDGVLLLNPDIGAKLKLDYVQKITLGGAGTQNPSEANVAINATLSLPGIRFENQPLIVATDTRMYDKVLWDGIVGKTIFGCVVELDFERSVINLYDKLPRSADSLGTEFKLTYTQGIPVAECRAILTGGNPLVGKFAIDTGVPFPLLLFQYADPRITRPAQLLMVAGEGLNGYAEFPVGRIPALHLGPHVLTMPLAAFADSATMGPAVALEAKGMIGLGALERFNVVFDYPGNRLFLSPNCRFDAPFETNMSGITFLVSRDRSIEVYFIDAHSPAAQSGIKKGDKLIAVNAQNVREMFFFRLLEKLFEAEGRELTLTLERDGRRFNSKLTLRRII
jgi:hypothetical protein